MYYEINVAKKITKSDGFIPAVTGEYYHLFATAKRSITDEKTLKKVLKIFVKVFPDPQFKISIIRNPEVSYGLSVEEVLSGIVV